uniref:START domain-containing protein n=1 Tax=Caenorhabditis tropicalis TaxID=1561998 RepID=A0A1I7UNN0_9PELO
MTNVFLSANSHWEVKEFDYDDDMIMPLDHGQFRGRAHSRDQDSPISYNEEIAKILGHTKHVDKVLTRQDTEEKKTQSVQTIQPLSDEEKNRLTLDPEFLDSFNLSCKVIGRALNEDIDIFINYTKDPYDKAIASDDLLHLAQVCHDDTWTAKRLVTGMTFSKHHPDLLAVSYGPCDVPNEPPGVIVVWNTKSKRVTAEFIVYCRSEIQSVSCLAVVGTKNAHNLFKLSCERCVYNHFIKTIVPFFTEASVIKKTLLQILPLVDLDSNDTSEADSVARILTVIGEKLRIFVLLSSFRWSLENSLVTNNRRRKQSGIRQKNK